MTNECERVAGCGLNSGHNGRCRTVPTPEDAESDCPACFGYAIGDECENCGGADGE